MEECFKGGGVDASCADAVPRVFARLGGDLVVRAVSHIVAYFLNERPEDIAFLLLVFFDLLKD